MRPRHRAKVRALHERADAHASAGDVGSALALSQQAVQYAFRHRGRGDPDLAQCFLHLARIQDEAGDLTAAEPSYNAASSILNPTEGEATPLKAELLLSYGTLYMRMGLGWRAILLLDHAKHRYLELGGPDSEHVGRCLSMIAVAYESAGVEDAALAAYDEAIRILRSAWGPDHPSVTYIDWSRADLAFWRAMKARDENGIERALADFRNGLARLEAESGRNDREAAHRRASLGTCLVVCERFDEGADLLADAIAILDAAGEDVNAFRRQLATARARLGDPADAFALLRRAIHEDPIGHRLAHGSERERMSALELANANLAQYLDLFMLAGRHDPAIIAEACNLVLSRKSLGAELLAVQRQAVARGDDAELAPLMARLAELRARSAQASLAGEPADETLVEIERVEWELASRIPEMDVTDRLPDFTHESAAALLPDASVLIEFVRFTRRTTMSADPDAFEDGSRDWYIAFVIPSGEPTVRLVDFGSARELDALIRACRAMLVRPEIALETAPARDLRRSAKPDDLVDAGATLRERLVDPLLGAIGDRTRLFIATDGDLTALPFGALRDAAGRFLIDTLDISYLSAGRDLKTLRSRPAGRTAGEALVLANPNYDLQSDTPLPASARSDDVDPDAVGLSSKEPLRRQLNDTGIRFTDLPGTREEGIAVAKLLRVEPLLGDEASEEHLKRARSPRVLHVATHGFFLAAPEAEPVGPGPSPRAAADAAAHNPLVRSGIALAGANAWLRGDPLPAHVQDGILNGEDIVSMDLVATELVVLSACETGLGDVVAGEGVMGLRRAFAVAGARTLILSLWKVPDLQTRLLMTSFYEALIEGKGRAEALKQAQFRVRAQDPSPWYWAAFICQGDPDPLQQ